MYASQNPKTKKALREAVEHGKNGGEYPEVFSPGPFPAPTNGRTSVEGPHYPAAHTWYAQVEVTDGKITKVIS